MPSEGANSVVLVLEFDRELTEEELHEVVPVLALRIRDLRVADDLPLHDARVLRVYGGATVGALDDGPPEPPPLRPV